MRYCREQDLLIAGQAGGVAYLHGGRTANALKAKGVDAGIPDLLILESGFDGTHGLAVEFKIDDNQLTDAQAAWFSRAVVWQRMNLWTWCCECVRSYGEFLAVVREHAIWQEVGVWNGVQID